MGKYKELVSIRARILALQIIDYLKSSGIDVMVVDLKDLKVLVLSTDKKGFTISYEHLEKHARNERDSWFLKHFIRREFNDFL